MGGFGAKPGQVQQGSSQVRFNTLSKEVPGKVWEAEPGQVQQGSGEFSGEDLGGSWRTSERLCVQSQVKFNKALEKVPEKVPGSLGAKLSQGQQGFGEGSGEGLGGFGAEPGHVQQGSGVPEKVPSGFGAEPGQVQHGSGEGSGEGLGGARSGSTGFRRRFRRSS